MMTAHCSEGSRIALPRKGQELASMPGVQVLAAVYIIRGTNTERKPLILSGSR